MGIEGETGHQPQEEVLDQKPEVFSFPSPDQEDEVPEILPEVASAIQELRVEASGYIQEIQTRMDTIKVLLAETVMVVPPEREDELKKAIGVAGKFLDRISLLLGQKEGVIALDTLFRSHVARAMMLMEQWTIRIKEFSEKSKIGPLNKTETIQFNLLLQKPQFENVPKIGAPLPEIGVHFNTFRSSFDELAENKVRGSHIKE